MYGLSMYKTSGRNDIKTEEWVVRNTFEIDAL